MEKTIASLQAFLTFLLARLSATQTTNSVDLPEVNCVSVEGARNAGEASESERRSILLYL